ncbi:MAG: hypothetical protein ACFFCP_09095 [Promethearchaeota archaeon]
MKNEKTVLCLSIMFTLLALSFTPQICSASLVWSEPFDELDSGIWIAQSCRLQDGRLRGIDANTSWLERKVFPLSDSIIAYRNSSISVGTWKLELEEMGGWDIEKSINDMTRVYFMLSGTPTDVDSYLALSFRHASSTDGSFFSYRIEKYVDGVVTLLNTYSGEAKETTVGILHQFTITRSSNGLISVYLNGTQILRAVDTDITTTQYFGLYTRIDWALDNIEVFDSIELGSGPPLALVAAGLGISIVLVAVALLAKRQSSL